MPTIGVMTFWLMQAVLFGIGGFLGWAFVSTYHLPSPGSNPKSAENARKAKIWTAFLLGGCALFGFFDLWGLVRDGGPPPGYIWSDNGSSGEQAGLYYHTGGRDFLLHLEEHSLLYMDGEGKQRSVPGRVMFHGNAPPHFREEREPSGYGYPVD